MLLIYQAAVNGRLIKLLMEEDDSMKNGQKEIKWHRLDNTANIFPVITSERLSNVYRISVILNEKIIPQYLQEALDIVLPWFDVFNVRLRRGIFWYYFETNKHKAKIEEENNYPCRYIDPYSYNKFLFRVSYYENRINVEVFHVLTDGMGAITFLKELVYQYLRLVHEELHDILDAKPSEECSLDYEDSYLKYYKKMPSKGYKNPRAYQLKGEFLPPTVMSVIHGYLNLNEVKAVSKSYGVSINQYLTAVLVYAIYDEYFNRQPSGEEISINVPMNLRGMFESATTQNFFAVLFARFKPEKEEYTFEDILKITNQSLKEQMKKENLERLISYNVSNEKKFYIRAIPLFIKNIGIKLIYNKSSKAFTTTLTNLGCMSVREECEKYVKGFNVILSSSYEQSFKCSVCTWKNDLVFTFSSVLNDTKLQKAFFRKIAKDGITVRIESNGVYDEKM